MGRKRVKTIRLVAAIVSLVLGSVFMLIPFIPLGYILLFVGVYLLIPFIPKLDKLNEKIKKKDKSDRLDKTEDKVDAYVDKTADKSNRI